MLEDWKVELTALKEKLNEMGNKTVTLNLEKSV